MGLRQKGRREHRAVVECREIGPWTNRLYNKMTDGGGVHTINNHTDWENLNRGKNTKDTTKDNTDCDRGRHWDYDRE